MKKRIYVTMLAVLILLFTAAFSGIKDRAESTPTEATQYDRGLTELDLSGEKELNVDELCSLVQLQKLDLRDTELTIAEYEKLREALPDCEISWQVPFRGMYLEPNTKELTITSLAQEDLESLRYLTELEKVNARECEDLDMLLALRDLHPGAKVEYIVSVDGRNIPSDTAELMIVDPDMEELGRMLKYLPDLENLVLTGDIPGNEQVWELLTAYPNVRMVWDVELLGEKFISTSKEIDISGIQVEDLSIVENALRYFPELEKIIMCDCGQSSEALDAMWKRNPQVRVVWSVPIRFFSVRTDITYLMPYQYGCTMLTNDDVDSLKYLVDLVCIDFGHMGISDLSFLYTMPEVKYLLLCECGIVDITPIGSLKKLEYLELFVNNISDISPLAGCTELRDLNMCYNRVSDISPLLELEHLEHIWIKGNFVTAEQRDQLEEAFPDAKIITYSTEISSTAGGWRQIPRYYEQRDYLGMWY